MDELKLRRQKRCAESWKGHDFHVTPQGFVECTKCGLRVHHPSATPEDEVE